MTGFRINLFNLIGVSSLTLALIASSCAVNKPREAEGALRTIVVALSRRYSDSYQRNLWQISRLVNNLFSNRAWLDVRQELTDNGFVELKSIVSPAYTDDYWILPDFNPQSNLEIGKQKIFIEVSRSPSTGDAHDWVHSAVAGLRIEVESDFALAIANSRIPENSFVEKMLRSERIREWVQKTPFLVSIEVKYTQVRASLSLYNGNAWGFSGVINLTNASDTLTNRLQFGAWSGLDHEEIDTPDEVRRTIPNDIIGQFQPYGYSLTERK